MSVKDYLVMRTPPARLGAGNESAPGTVSKSRIALSFLGIILGIVASFYVTGLRPTTTPATSSNGQAHQERATTGVAQDAQEPSVTKDFSLRRLGVVGLISLVICCLTYQGLYLSLRLYQYEPAFLIFFISFQYGYFWQSMVKGAAAFLSA
jgi:hypothetical protein